MKASLRFCLIVSAFLALIYYPTLHYPLLNGWDDPEYITSNETIRSLDLPHIKKMFTSFSMGNYAPIHILSYAVDFRIFGPRPWGFRLTNLLIHFLNSILVFLLVRKLNRSEWTALVVGLLFAIHPLQVESVAWISQRKNVLSTLFLLWAFLVYADSTERDDVFRYWLSLVLYMVGLLAKVSIIVFPLYIIGYDFLLKKKFSLRRLARYVPFIVLSAAAGWITLGAQVGGVRAEYYGDSLLQSIFLVPTLWFIYLRQVFLPFRLSALYDEKIIAGFPPEKVLAVMLFVALMAFLIYRWTKTDQRVKLFWLFWFLVGLAPVLHFVPMVTIMNDRYLYFPMVGILALVALSVGDLIGRFEGRAAPIIASFLVACTVAGLSFLSIQRAKVWVDELALWSDAVSKFPNQAKARSNIGSYYMGRDDLEKALSEFKKALEIRPDLYVGRLSLGACYVKMKRYRLAIPELQKAIKIFDGDPQAHYYLGMSYYFTGKNDPAIQELRWVVDRFPEWSEVTLNLIRICLVSDRKEEAETLMKSARKWYRNDFDVLSELGKISYHVGP